LSSANKYPTNKCELLNNSELIYTDGMIACKSPQVFCSIRKTSISCLRLLLLGPSSNSTILIIRNSLSLQMQFQIKFLLTGHGRLVAWKVRILSPGQGGLQGHLFYPDTQKVLERTKRRDSLTLQSVTVSGYWLSSTSWERDISRCHVVTLFTVLVVVIVVQVVQQALYG
jgi:hypothetical protein